MNFGKITHIIENPRGHAPGWNYSLVGSVPADLNRVKFETVTEILEAFKSEQPTTLCAHPTCLCRKLFPAWQGGQQ